MNTLFGSMLDAGIETKILSAIDAFFILYRRIQSWKKCFEIFIERLYQKWATGVAKIWILKCEDFVAGVSGASHRRAVVTQIHLEKFREPSYSTT